MANNANFNIPFNPGADISAQILQGLLAGQQAATEQQKLQQGRTQLGIAQQQANTQQAGEESTAALNAANIKDIEAQIGLRQQQMEMQRKGINYVFGDGSTAGSTLSDDVNKFAKDNNLNADELATYLTAANEVKFSALKNGGIPDMGPLSKAQDTIFSKRNDLHHDDTASNPDDPVHSTWTRQYYDSADRPKGPPIQIPMPTELLPSQHTTTHQEITSPTGNTTVSSETSTKGAAGTKPSTNVGGQGSGPTGLPAVKDYMDKGQYGKAALAAGGGKVPTGPVGKLPVQNEEASASIDDINSLAPKALAELRAIDPTKLSLAWQHFKYMGHDWLGKTDDPNYIAASKFFQTTGLANVEGLGRVLHGVRNPEVIKSFETHLPSTEDSPTAAIAKLQDLPKDLRVIQNNLYRTSSVDMPPGVGTPPNLTQAEVKTYVDAAQRQNPKAPIELLRAQARQWAQQDGWNIPSK